MLVLKLNIVSSQLWRTKASGRAGPKMDWEVILSERKGWMGDRRLKWIAFVAANLPDTFVFKIPGCLPQLFNRLTYVFLQSTPTSLAIPRGTISSYVPDTPIEKRKGAACSESQDPKS